MIISKNIPPIFQRCKDVFHVKWEDGIAITYGDTVYSKNPLSEDLVVHEQVHIEQQEKYGGAEVWWDRYLIDKKFRLTQEVEAYKAQSAYLKEFAPRNYRKFKLEQIVKDLSSAVYGNMVTYQEAKKLLQ